MLRKSFTCLSICYIFLFFGFFNNTQAQTPNESLVEVETMPRTYGPGEAVNIALSSYSENLDVATFNWYLGGKLVSSGIGKKSFSTISGEVGADIKITVNIVTSGKRIEKVIYLRSNSSVLLWEALDSHVPPFYKGKALPSSDSQIKVVAMPEIKLGNTNIDPKSLTYSWKKDYNNETDSSGYGKNYFIYINDYLERFNDIEVMASTISQDKSTTANVTVSATEPQILFYKKDSILGTLWEKEVTNGYLVTNGETILAEPYFISPKDIRRPDLVFSWFINGAPISISSLRKNSVPLGIPEGTTGTSSLKLEVENSNKIFQFVEKEINLSF